MPALVEALKVLANEHNHFDPFVADNVMVLVEGCTQRLLFYAWL